MNILDNFYFLAFLLVLSGCGLAIQGACNGTLGRLTAKSFAALASFGIGFIPMFLYFMIETHGSTNPTVSTNAFNEVPWWGWIGGALGVVYVFSQVLSIPKIGAASFVALVVPTQIIVTVLMDNFAVAGVKKRPLTWQRGLGCLGMVISVFVITKFSGTAEVMRPDAQPNTIVIELDDDEIPSSVTK
ncbi:hypothetical protein K7432_009899 [Basidiobolus ranarum]|uniref:DMT family transporter n=1 Tax=Basidiobolus ranarum TaxID=34480 RepID=A0ABR2VWD0_9FUNG